MSWSDGELFGGHMIGIFENDKLVSKSQFGLKPVE
jgi:hypothetical protein